MFDVKFKDSRARSSCEWGELDPGVRCAAVSWSVHGDGVRHGISGRPATREMVTMGSCVRSRRGSRSTFVEIGCRADFFGGFSDIVPECQGAVLALMISVYGSPSTITARWGSRVHSVDVVVNGQIVGGVLADTARAWFDELEVNAPLTLEVCCRVPEGSGLGISSQLVTGCLAALARVAGKPPARRDLVRSAYVMENALDSCGWQDQAPYIAGGFVFAYAPAASGPRAVRPCYKAISVTDSVLIELQQRSLLVYTGKSHFSAACLNDVKRRIYGREANAIRAWDRLRSLAVEGRDVLAASNDPVTNVDRLGSLMTDNWNTEIALTDGSVQIAALEALSSDLKKLGGFKLLGAGRGGHLFLIAHSVDARADAEVLLGEADMPKVPWTVSPSRARVYDL
jgi:galactokinase/mevalonate kinase-like predicted kinase